MCWLLFFHSTFKFLCKTFMPKRKRQKTLQKKEEKANGSDKAPKPSRGQSEQDTAPEVTASGEEEGNRKWSEAEEAVILRMMGEYERGERREISHRAMAQAVGRSVNSVKCRWNNTLKQRWAQMGGRAFAGSSTIG